MAAPDGAEAVGVKVVQVDSEAATATPARERAAREYFMVMLICRLCDQREGSKPVGMGGLICGYLPIFKGPAHSFQCPPPTRQMCYIWLIRAATTAPIWQRRGLCILFPGRRVTIFVASAGSQPILPRANEEKAVLLARHPGSRVFCGQVRGQLPTGTLCGR